jgi:hypothetical protein
MQKKKIFLSFRNMKKLSKDIIKKIKKEDISQRPKILFLVKNIALWGAFGLSVLLGSITFSLVIYAIFEIDFDLITHPKMPRIQYFLTVVPLVYMLSICLFLFLANFCITHTKKGYKIPIFFLLAGNILVSMIIGFMLYAGGTADFLDQRTHIGDSREHRQREFWARPEEGFLAGRIIEVSGDTLFFLEDFSGTTWTIETKNIPERLCEKDDDDILGKKVQILGEKVGKTSFFAEEIFPWRRGMGGKNQKGPHFIMRHYQ